jgi:AmiR/NasT family two-component response regulator
MTNFVLINNPTESEESRTIKALTQRIAQLERQLAERKIIERAKGILQAQLGITEEEAYYQVRRTSRQQRTPMATIARRIIEASEKAVPERLSA